MINNDFDTFIGITIKGNIIIQIPRKVVPARKSDVNLQNELATGNIFSFGRRRMKFFRDH